MSGSAENFAALERAYRQARWTIIGHALFLAGCCAAAIFLRRLFRLPPALLGVVLIVALVAFGGDIMKFLRRRDDLRRAQRATSSS
jgi:hypothetical protein